MHYLLFGIVILFCVGVFFWGQSRQSRDGVLNQLQDAYRLGDGQEGDRLLDEARQVFTTTRERLRLIGVLFEARAWPQAMNVAQETIKHAPNNKRLRRYKARLSGALMTDDAVNLLRRWVEENPQDDRALLDLARLYYRLRWKEELQQLMVPYVQSHPDSREGQSLLGRAYFATGQLDLATKHLQHAQKLRGLAERHRVAVYGFMGGAEHEVTAQEQVQATDDARLLEQIEDGSARNKTASFIDTGEQNALTEPSEPVQASDSK